MERIGQFNLCYVGHDICQQCVKHNVTCMPGDDVCAAVEILVQLCKVKSEDKQMEYLHNIGTRLDLENSYNGMPDQQT